MNPKIFFYTKNKILKKILIWYYLIFYIKSKCKFNFNLNKDIILDINFIFSKNNKSVFNYRFFFKFVVIIYKILYSFFFLNQKLNILINNNYFYKNTLINFNKTTLPFYNCVNAFLTKNFLFYKFMDENFFSLIFKNFKKLSKQNNFLKLVKKHNVLSKTNFFKIKSLGKKLKLFNNNTIFYFFLVKNFKKNLISQNKSYYFFKNQLCFFYSSIYTYNLKFKSAYLNSYNNIYFLIFNKSFNMNTTYFYNFFLNYPVIEDIIYVDLPNNFKNTDSYSVNLIFKKYFIYLHFFLKICFIKKNYNAFFKIQFFWKTGKIFNIKANTIQNYFSYKYILKSLLIINDSFYDYSNNYQFFYSNFYLLNIFNNFVTQHDNIDLNYNLNKFKFNFYNNHYPMFFFKNNFIDFFLSKIKKTKKATTFKFMQFYLIGFFEHLFKKKIFIKALTNSKLEYFHIDRLEFLFDEFKFFQLRIIRGLYVNEILEIIWLSFQTRDVFLFMGWLKKRMEKIHFKNHKKFLNLLKMIFTKYSHIFLESFRLRGFFFDIRGKVGVGGNSKKRHFFFRIGKINLSTKTSKLDHHQNIVNTSFGALGVTMILSY